MTRRSVVAGVGSALPKRRVTNEELARTVDTTDEWIVERTGIRNRYIAGDGETTATLATDAARAALAHAGLQATDIDLIVLATATPDQTFPSTATKVQAALGINDCVAFDVWISNRDRNIGNVVAEPVGGREGSDVRLYAIDFEKADVLRGVSRFEITAKHTPRECWPVNELAQHFAGLQRPAGMCGRISGVTEDAIRAVFDEVAFNLAGHSVSWCDSASNYLASRASRIRELVAEAWQ